MSESGAAAFELDRTLAGDTHLVGDLELARVLLMDDARFPWLILVPRIAAMRDLVDLPVHARHALTDEIDRCARVLRAVHAPHKLNVAALGNVVAQLHVHVIARHIGDAAWPKPVWGIGEREPYAADVLTTALTRLRGALGLVVPG